MLCYTGCVALVYHASTIGTCPQVSICRNHLTIRVILQRLNINVVGIDIKIHHDPCTSSARLHRKSSHLIGVYCFLRIYYLDQYVMLGDSSGEFTVISSLINFYLLFGGPNILTLLFHVTLLFFHVTLLCFH